MFRIDVPVFKPAAPKHLTETEYQRLLETVLSATDSGSVTAIAERAWFLTLAHTGMRVGELLDLRFRSHPESDNYGVRGGSEHDVSLGDRPTAL